MQLTRMTAQRGVTAVFPAAFLAVFIRESRLRSRLLGPLSRIHIGSIPAAFPAAFPPVPYPYRIHVGFHTGIHIGSTYRDLYGIHTGIHIGIHVAHFHASSIRYSG